MQTILLIGADEILLNTRAAILRHTGAEVVCSPPSTALAVQADRHCELVMLCHSLQPEVCASLAETIRAGWPNAQILLIQRQNGWAPVDVEVVVDATSSPEPSRLIGTTTELLRRAPGRSTGEIQVRGGIARAGPFAQ